VGHCGGTVLSQEAVGGKRGASALFWQPRGSRGFAARGVGELDLIPAEGGHAGLMPPPPAERNEQEAQEGPRGARVPRTRGHAAESETSQLPMQYTMERERITRYLPCAAQHTAHSSSTRLPTTLALGGLEEQLPLSMHQGTAARNLLMAWEADTAPLSLPRSCH